MANHLLICCIALLSLIATLDYANAECCYSACRGYCLDCTGATPYCGYGKCNIFGCNCDGGCRRPSSSVCAPCYWLKDEQVSAVTDATVVFRELDQNGDHKVDLLEATAWMRRRGQDTEDVAETFQQLDHNRDGFLSFYEIDD